MDDDIEAGIMPTGIVVDKASLIYWPTMSWSTPNDSGTFTSGSATINGLKNNQNSYVFSDRWLTSTDVGQIVNLDMGTVTVRDPRWYENTVSISGYFNFGAQMMESGATPMTGTSYWVGPSSYEYTLSLASGNITGSGSGSRVKFDINFDEPETIRGITINFYFGVKSFNTSNFSTANSGLRGAYLWWQSRSSVRFTQDGADAQYKDDLLSGINEGNQLQAQTNGLLNTVISGVNDVITSITELPSKIAEAIKGLFVPSQEDLTAIKGKYEQLLADRLGFVYQAGDMVTGFFTDFSSALQSDAEYEFVFPGIAFPMNGEMIVICEEMPVDLDNDVMAALRPVLGTIITIISVLGFLNVASDMFEAMISGKTYHDFLHRKDDDG